MKHTKALANLRLLCCSGLSKEIVISEFLRLVPSVIQSNNNTFSGSDGGLRPTYHISGFDDSDLADVIPVVSPKFHTPSLIKRTESLLKEKGLITNPTLVHETFYLTEMYNLVYRPFDMHHILWGATQNNGDFNGMLCLYRPKWQKPFDSRDQKLFKDLLPLVSHALNSPAIETIQYNLDSRQGLLLLDSKGTILYQNNEAKVLLKRITHPRLQKENLIFQQSLMAELKKLCQKMDSIRHNQDASPPIYSHTGPWGRFIFRAYHLEHQQSEQGGLVGVTVEHQEPVVLKLLRGLRELPLSPMQKEVSLLLAQGIPTEQIGSRLGIKPTTLKDHIRKIYTNLNINKRDELAAKILSSSPRSLTDR